MSFARVIDAICSLIVGGNDSFPILAVEFFGLSFLGR